MARRVDSSAKNISDFPGWNIPHMVETALETKKRDIPSYLSSLVRQAEQRKTHLIVLPQGMTRQKENKTRYIFNKGIIMWYCKWILSSSIPALSFTSKTSELENVGQVFMLELSKLSVRILWRSLWLEPSLSFIGQVQGSRFRRIGDFDWEVCSLHRRSSRLANQAVLHCSTRSLLPGYFCWDLHSRVTSICFIDL